MKQNYRNVALYFLFSEIILYIIQPINGSGTFFNLPTPFFVIIFVKIKNPTI